MRCVLCRKSYYDVLEVNETLSIFSCYLGISLDLITLPGLGRLYLERPGHHRLFHFEWNIASVDGSIQVIKLVEDVPELIEVLLLHLLSV
jgi:hypothetical protein